MTPRAACCTNFNSRSPCGERPHVSSNEFSSLPFQPALPLRGATKPSRGVYRFGKFQSALPLRGATAVCVITMPTLLFQSALPLRGATERLVRFRTAKVFQPALPLRGATGEVGDSALQDGISTRAPLAGSDVTTAFLTTVLRRFQPALPLRGATRFIILYSRRDIFQPALPLRGATEVIFDHRLLHLISTRAPLAGSDQPRTRDRHRGHGDFNPRSPCGERLRVVS